MYALIASGVVVDLYAPPAGIVPGRDVLCGIGAWVDCTATPDVAHGWTYAGGVFAAPAPPAPPPPVTTMTPLTFMARFTDAETSAIHTSAMSNVALFGWLLSCAAATAVDLTDSRTRAGLDALVSAGLLTAERETAILTP